MADEGSLLGPRALAQVAALIEADRRRVKNPPAGRGRGPVSNGLSIYVAKVTGTIARREGKKPGSASCKLYKLDDGELVEVNEDAEPTTVYNLSGVALELPTEGDDRTLYVPVVQDRFGKYYVVPGAIPPGTCDLTGPIKIISGFAKSSKQALTHTADGCLAWQTISTCPSP